MANHVFRKSLVIGIIILFLGAGFIPSAMSGEFKTIKTISSARATWTVDDEVGDGDFSCIQCAIDDSNVNPGDIIKVYSGIYNENVVVNKKLTIIGLDEELPPNGSDTGLPIIDGGKNSDVVFLSNDGISLSGFIIKNSGSDNAGLRIQSNNNIIEYNNILDNEGYGIFIWEGNGNEIKYCEIINNNDIGIYLDRDSGFNEIHNCTIEGNFYGIKFCPNGENNQNSIRNNDIIGNGNIGIWISGDGNDDKYDVIEGNKIKDHGDRGIEITNLTHCRIINNREIDNNGNIGIRFAYGKDCEISGNYHIKNHKKGIVIYYAEDTDVICNKIFSNSYGIWLEVADDNFIWGNTIKWSDTYSIQLSGSRRNEIKKNNFLYNLEDGKHAIFYNSFNTVWLMNFWDDSEGGFFHPRRIPGSQDGVPTSDWDWLPSTHEWNICPPNIKLRQSSIMLLLQIFFQRLGLQ